MSIKKLSELKNMTGDELRSHLKTSESELFQSKLKLATGQLSNTSLIWKSRKEIARIKTLLTVKSEGAQS